MTTLTRSKSAITQKRRSKIFDIGLKPMKASFGRYHLVDNDNRHSKHVYFTGTLHECEAYAREV